MLKKALVYLVVLLTLCASFGMPAASAESVVQKAKKLPYWLEVDIANQLVVARSTTDNSIVRVMICSTGLRSGATPRGTFYMPKKKYSTERGPWHSMIGGVYARYATRIHNRIMFHSILYRKKKVSTLVKDSWTKLGKRASHGCIRLTPLDAQWIAYHCATNTRVVIKSGKVSAERKTLRTDIKKSLPAARKDGTLPGWEPTLTPTPTPPPPTLSQGSQGSAVTNYHKRLRALGFYSGALSNKYTAKTTTATKRLQAAMGLKQTGKATHVLRQSIQSDDTPTGTYVTFKKGDKGPAVKRIQTELKALKLFKGKANGSYQASTVAAVKAFYMMAGMTVSSNATPAMQRKLRTMAAEASAPEATPSPTPKAAR